MGVFDVEKGNERFFDEVANNVVDNGNLCFHRCRTAKILRKQVFLNNARISVLFNSDDKLLPLKSFQNTTTELDRERSEEVSIDPNAESLVITIEMKIEFDNLH